MHEDAMEKVLLLLGKFWFPYAYIFSAFLEQIKLEFTLINKSLGCLMACSSMYLVERVGLMITYSILALVLTCTIFNITKIPCYVGYDNQNTKKRSQRKHLVLGLIFMI